MFKRKTALLVVPVVLVLFYLLSFQFNDWLSVTMPRHQLIQLPAMLMLGVILAYGLHRPSINDMYWGIASLIFVMSSLIFWMLPRSVDYAVINSDFNRVMHVNMIICGYLLVAVLRNIIFEIKILFMGMVTAMLMATGITLRVFDILLCSSFDIYQQKQTGLYLLIAGITLFGVTIAVFFRSLSKRTTET